MIKRKFFDDDPFEDIVREFFSPARSGMKRNSRTIINGEEEDRSIDFIEEDGIVHLIFELPGYEQKDIEIIIKGNNLEIKASKKDCELDGVRDYLTQKLCNGIRIKKILPDFINPKDFKSTVKNGILELKFKKK